MIKLYEWPCELRNKVKDVGGMRLLQKLLPLLIFIETLVSLGETVAASLQWLHMLAFCHL